MMFLYKITEVKFTLASNEDAAYISTPCSRPHRRLSLTAILLKFSQINLKLMYTQKTGK